MKNKIPILVLALIISIIGISGCTSNASNSDYLTPISQSEASSYMASCTQPNLAELIKDPNSFIGQKIKVTGTIFQITQNNDGSTYILLDTPQTTSYTDRVYITYGGKTSFVKGDKITAYGIDGGSYSYKSVEGYQITLPFIKAVYIK